MKVYLDKHSTETYGKVRRREQLDSLEVWKFWKIPKLKVLENTKTKSFGKHQNYSSFGKHVERKGGIIEVYLWKLYRKFTLENLQCVEKQ